MVPVSWNSFDWIWPAWSSDHLSNTSGVFKVEGVGLAISWSFSCKGSSSLQLPGNVSWMHLWEFVFQNLDILRVHPLSPIPKKKGIHQMKEEVMVWATVVLPLPPDILSNSFGSAWMSISTKPSSEFEVNLQIPCWTMALCGQSCTIYTFPIKRFNILVL